MIQKNDPLHREFTQVKVSTIILPMKSQLAHQLPPISLLRKSESMRSFGVASFTDQPRLRGFAGPHLIAAAAWFYLLLLAPATVAAEALPPTPMQSRIRLLLPNYSPEEHARAEAEMAAEAARAKAAAEDPDLVVLPLLTVRERVTQRMEEEALYRNGAYDEELVKRELSAFDRYFLNRFTLPLFGVSKEARARAAYLERKNREFNTRVRDLAQVIGTVDRTEAAALRTALLPWP